MAEARAGQVQTRGRQKGPRTRDRATVPTSGSGMVTHEDKSRLCCTAAAQPTPGLHASDPGFLLIETGVHTASLTKVSGQARGQGMLSVWCSTGTHHTASRNATRWRVSGSHPPTHPYTHADRRRGCTRMARDSPEADGSTPKHEAHTPTSCSATAEGSEFKTKDT